MDIYFNNNLIDTITNNSNNIRVDFNNTNKVLDEIRGYLVYIDNGWNFVGVSQIKLFQNNKTIKKIALILESPHKDEYNTNFVPIRPANGKTGRNIQNKICQINSNKFNTKSCTANLNLNSNFIYMVKIINSIQYQCSCYYWLKKNDRIITEKVFRILFKNNKCNLETDFKNRIKQYAPDIIINACTSNLGNGIVYTAIRQAIDIKIIQYLRCKHPSVW